MNIVVNGNIIQCSSENLGNSRKGVVLSHGINLMQ